MRFLIHFSQYASHDVRFHTVFNHFVMISADHSMRPKFGIINVYTENRTILCPSFIKYSCAGETVFECICDFCHDDFKMLTQKCSQMK